MPKVVLDSSVLVSAFLNPTPGGASYDLLRFAAQGAFALYLSDAIVAETARVLVTSTRNRSRYNYTEEDVALFCRTILGLATMVTNVPEVRGVVRDPNDDVIVASGIAAGAEYLISRDKDLLSLGSYKGISIIAPETFLHVLRDPPSA
jgi:putative PIN family toxin of toxin-antitoxin system